MTTLTNVIWNRITRMIAFLIEAPNIIICVIASICFVAVIWLTTLMSAIGPSRIPIIGIGTTAPYCDVRKTFPEASSFCEEIATIIENENISHRVKSITVRDHDIVVIELEDTEIAAPEKPQKT